MGISGTYTVLYPTYQTAFTCSVQCRYMCSWCTWKYLPNGPMASNKTTDTKHSENLLQRGRRRKEEKNWAPNVSWRIGWYTLHVDRHLTSTKLKNDWATQHATIHTHRTCYTLLKTFIISVIDAWHIVLLLSTTHCDDRR